MSPRLPRVLAALVLPLAVLATVPGAAWAQYFGRNKVQYETFHFQVLKTEHFDVYFYREEERAAEEAAGMAERWYARYSRYFDHELSSRQPLILYASPSAFQQTNAIPGEIGEGTGGVTEATRRRIVLPLGSSLAESDHVIGHELVHAFQYDITGHGRTQSAGGMPTAVQMPLWFIEGMAEFLSLGPVDPHTAMWMRDAAVHNKLPSYRQLDDPRFFPYRYGQALLAYVAGRWGDGTIPDLLRFSGKNGDVDQAIQRVLGISGDSLDKAWQADVKATYDTLQARTQPATAYGPQVIAGQTEATGLNVGPVVSPDGSKIVFYSARDLFSIEMFMADAHTGQILRRVTKTAVDPHFQSLEFINSAGSFNASGQRFVFSALSGGRPVLDIIDVASGSVRREVPFPSLGEILHPAWSPDGRYVAFSALSGGLADLYLYDLETDSLRRLTNDSYTDLEPAWSPDGRQLAFVTDRFSTDTATLRPGNYRLALMDVATGSIEQLPSFEDAKNINPQWSSDGASIYFLSDRGGITNIFRLALATGERTQVTNLLTGVSGITSLSPAMSVASETGRVVYSVYEKGNYAVYKVDSTSALAGTTLEPLPAVSPALLPPDQRKNNQVLAYLADYSAGQKAASTQTISAYHPRLGLDYIAQPYLAVGASSFGTFVGGGVTLYWSDMLGDQNLATMLQVQGNFKNLAALVAYQNTRRRLNWGLAVQQIPYLSGGYLAGLANDPQNGTVYVEQLQLLREINREADVFFAWPFSQVQRIEWSAGVRNISFDAQAETWTYDPVTGRLISDNIQNLSAPKSLNLGMASAALVYDNSFFGATSPVLGQRYRLEADPIVGSMQFTSLLADYRRYIMPVRPFTIAARVMHYGRYGANAEDSTRLYPLFLGYASLVRGYDYNSVVNDCGLNGACATYDRLFGSRILVANLELRFPLLGVLGIGHGYYGAFPIEAAVFADGGVAYNRGERPSIFGGPRKPVTSAGAALRVNLFGFAIAEVDLVHPFNWPGKGWTWQLSLNPGF
jgi:Tol biopolymer transport system component